MLQVVTGQGDAKDTSPRNLYVEALTLNMAVFRYDLGL